VDNRAQESLWFDYPDFPGNGHQTHQKTALLPASFIPFQE
jgi:hypothetical protein